MLNANAGNGETEAPPKVETEAPSGKSRFPKKKES